MIVIPRRREREKEYVNKWIIIPINLELVELWAKLLVEK